MSKRIPKLLLEDISESIDKINAYLTGYSFEQFRLPDEIKSANIAIDWQRIRGFRNRIVHDYMGIDYQVVWLIIQDYLPELRLEITRIQLP